MSGGNWWRANEIVVIRHHSRESETAKVPVSIPGALIRAAERWRGLRFTEFELRQIAALRKDLNDEYQTSTTPLARSSQPRVSSKSMP
jgi:hypothetical protein